MKHGDLVRTYPLHGHGVIPLWWPFVGMLGMREIVGTLSDGDLTIVVHVGLRVAMVLCSSQVIGSTSSALFEVVTS